MEWSWLSWWIPGALAIGPGLSCVLLASRRREVSLVEWGAALALSAPVASGAVAILCLAGVVPRAASTIVALGSLIGCAGSWFLARRTGESDARTAHDPGGIPRLRIVGFALAVCGLVSVLPLAYEWWRISSDAWTHAAIIRSVLDFGVPPLDPGYAGLRLQYPWFYHALIAAEVACSGIDSFALMSFHESVALLGLVLAAPSLLGRWSVGRSLLPLGVLVFGLNALFPLFLPISFARAFLGEVRGLDEVLPQFDLFPLNWDRTGVLLRSLGGQDFFLNKWMVATPFSLGLAAFVVVLGAVRRFLDDGRRGELVLVGVGVLGAGLMHPVIGIHVFATLLPAIFVSWWGLRRAPLGRRLLQLAVTALVVAVPFAVGLSKLMGGAGGAHRDLPIDLAPVKILGYASCLALGVLLAAKPVERMLRAGGPDRVWALWILAAVGFAAVIRLPGPSPFFTVDKFSYLVWIPLAPLAGAELHRHLVARGRGFRLALLALLFIPVNGLALASRFLDPHNGAEQPFTKAGYAWGRTHLPKDAVLVTPHGDWDSGGFLLRDQYYSLDQAAIQLGYPFDEMEARRALVDRVFVDGVFGATEREQLARLNRPVYAVWTNFRDPAWKWTPGAWARTPATLVADLPENLGGGTVHADSSLRILELIAPGPR